MKTATIAALFVQFRLKAEEVLKVCPEVQLVVDVRRYQLVRGIFQLCAF